jgi:hypothetical protein
MNEGRVSRKLLHGKVEGIRRRGRPRKRWLQALEKDMRVMHFGRWWGKMQSKEEWRPKPTPGYNAEEGRSTMYMYFDILQHRYYNFDIK